MRATSAGTEADLSKTLGTVKVSIPDTCPSSPNCHRYHTTADACYYCRKCWLEFSAPQQLNAYDGRGRA